MYWDAYQRTRLAQEASALRRYMPAYSFYDGGRRVSGWWSSNLNRRYEIQVYLPAAYPDTVPNTYITYPSPLHGYYELVEKYGDSHQMHTWRTDRPGWVKVCIVRPEDWSAAYSLLKVLRKAQLWITAYESHLYDGKPIADFLL